MTNDPIIGTIFSLVWWFDGDRIRLAHKDQHPQRRAKAIKPKARRKFQREQKQQKEEL